MTSEVGGRLKGAGQKNPSEPVLVENQREVRKQERLGIKQNLPKDLIRSRQGGGVN